MVIKIPSSWKKSEEWFLQTHFLRSRLHKYCVCGWWRFFGCTNHIERENERPEEELTGLGEEESRGGKRKNAHVTAKGAQCGHQHSGSPCKLVHRLPPNAGGLKFYSAQKKTTQTPLRRSLAGLPLDSMARRLTLRAPLKACPVSNHPGHPSFSQETTIHSSMPWTWL